ncbi:MAG TPA: hypothetical protein VFB60_01545 [Ktedonobacteraceae bacterium]|nr:hypothetical protein [Ktedonobacteraceae bacterium]
MKVEPQNWREILGELVSTPQEKERVTNELGITSITLSRWIAGVSIPRVQNVRHLLRLFPEHREALSQSMRKEFSGFLDFGSEETSPSEIENIPANFYTSVLEAFRATPSSLRFWSIAKFILYQALEHLDPSRLGMDIIVAKCTSPRPGQKVRSLRETIGLGTSPWLDSLEAKGIFYGIESFAGYAVYTRHSLIMRNLTHNEIYVPVQHTESTASVVACPILRAGCVAGCVMASSTQSGYFVPSKLALIEKYTDLMSLAFADSDFYSLEDIELGTMPSYQIQMKHFSDFRQRIVNVMKQATMSKHPMTLVEAEQRVLHDLEDELLQVSNVEETSTSI